MNARVILLASGLACAPAFGGPQSVVNSKHNLSTGGPGPVHAASEQEICIFCHAPHNASPVRPLWNRDMPVDSYSIYTSKSLDARPGQPTGNSKLCLSCHDGTIALGSIVSRDTEIFMAGGITTLPPGSSNLSTDLADDHPISFRFDSSLVARDPKLRDPSTIPHELVLDINSELQCTTCHDAHNDSLGDFLVLRNDNSEMCMSCHQVGSTTITEHSNCNACHQPHTAPSGPYLLRKATISETCLECHDGSHGRAANIADELRKAFAHDTQSPVDPPPPASEHASCTDCHDPHTMSSGQSSAPAVHSSFGRIDGLSGSGSPLKLASYEYEVCYKCHADTSTQQPFIPRDIVQNNTRLEFDPGAISFHPVAAPGRNSFVPSLKPTWTTASRVYCSDCHNSESSEAGSGSGVGGVHGSNHNPILAARYETDDYTTESAQVYALCYKCHDRANILDNASFPGHKLHIVDQRTPCSVCHDAHGIASSQGSPTGNTNLINFDITVVQPNSAGRLEYRDMGQLRGECFLRCHNADHAPMSYP